MSCFAGEHTAELIATAQKLSTPGKGVLAADESTGTIGRDGRGDVYFFYNSPSIFFFAFFCPPTHMDGATRAPATTSPYTDS